MKVTAEGYEHTYPVTEFFSDLIFPNTDGTITVGIPAMSYAAEGRRAVEVFKGEVVIARTGFNVGDSKIMYANSHEYWNEVAIGGEYLENYLNSNPKAEVWLNGEKIASSISYRFMGELLFRFPTSFEPGANYRIKVFVNDDEKTEAEGFPFSVAPRLDLDNPIVSIAEGNCTLIIKESSYAEYGWQSDDAITVHVHGPEFYKRFETTGGNLTVNNDTVVFTLKDGFGNNLSLITGEYNVDVDKDGAKIGYGEFIVVQNDGDAIKGSVNNPDGSAADGGYADIHKVDQGWGTRIILGHDGKFYIRKERLKGTGDYEFIAIPSSSSQYASSSRVVTLDENGDIKDKDGSILNTVDITLNKAQVSGTVYVYSGGDKANGGRVDIHEVYDNNNWKWITGEDIASDGTYKIGGLKPNTKYQIVAIPPREIDYLHSDTVEIITDDSASFPTPVDLSFTKPQIRGIARDDGNELLNSGQYYINARSLYYHGSYKTKTGDNGIFMIGGLAPGEYMISIEPESNSIYVRSEEIKVVIDQNGIASPSSIELKLAQPKLTGSVIDKDGNTLSSDGYVEVYKGTWKNMQFISSVRVDINGTFRIGGIPDGDYYIRAIVNYGSEKFSSNSSSVFTPIKLGTTETVNLQLTDRSVPRIRWIMDTGVGSGFVNLHMYNLAGKTKDAFAAEILDAEGSSLTPSIQIPAENINITWVDEFSDEAGLEIYSESIKNLKAGKYKLKLSYNGVEISSDSPLQNEFIVLYYMDVSPKGALPSTAPGMLLKLFVNDGKGGKVSGIWKEGDTLSAKLITSNGVEYHNTIPCTINTDDTISINLPTDITLPDGWNYIEIYNKINTESILLGKADFVVGTPAIRRVQDANEGDNNVNVEGDYLAVYEKQGVSGEILDLTGKVLWTSAYVNFAWERLEFRFDDLQLPAGNFKFRIKDGTTVIGENSFNVVPQLICTPRVVPDQSAATLTVKNSSSLSEFKWSSNDSITDFRVYIGNSGPWFDIDSGNGLSFADDGSGNLIINISAENMQKLSFGEGKAQIDVYKNHGEADFRKIGFARFVLGYDIISGTVKNLENEPMPGVRVNIENISEYDRRGFSVFTDGEGKFNISKSDMPWPGDEIPTGDYSFVVMAPKGSSYGSAITKVNIDPAVTNNVILALPPAQITGTVKAGSENATGSRVEVLKPIDDRKWEYLYYIDVNSDGTFSFGGLDAGTYFIVAHAPEGLLFLHSPAEEVVIGDTVQDITVNLSPVQVVGAAWDAKGNLLEGYEYYLRVRSLEPEKGENDNGKWRTEYGKYYLGGLKPGSYAINMQPNRDSLYTQSLEEIFTVNPDGTVSREVIDLKFTNPKVIGAVRYIKDQEMLPLTEGYVDIFKGTWQNMHYITTVELDENGKFRIGGIPGGKYYIRAAIWDESPLRQDYSQSFMKEIIISDDIPETPEEIEEPLMLMDKTPRIRVVYDAMTGDDNLRLRMVNASKLVNTSGVVSGLTAEIMDQYGNPLANPIEISNPGNFSIDNRTWDFNKDEADILIRLSGNLNLKPGNYNLKLIYNEGTGYKQVVNETPFINGFNGFRILYWLHVNPYGVLPGTASLGKIIEISADGDSSQYPWNTGDSDKLIIKLTTEDETEYTLPCSIDANNIIKAELTSPPIPSEGLAKGRYRITVYKDEVLLGVSELHASEPYINGIFDSCEENDFITLYGINLITYEENDIVGKVYRISDATPVVTSSKVDFNWGHLNISLNNTRLIPGDYRLELYVDGAEIALPEDGIFTVANLLRATPSYLLTGNTSGKTVTLDAAEGITPWEIGDKLFISISCDNYGNEEYGPISVTAESVSSITFTMPDIVNEGHCSIFVYNENDPDHIKYIGYAHFEILEQTQLTGTIKDFAENPVPYSSVLVFRTDEKTGEHWVMRFDADGEGNYAVYGIEPGEYTVFAIPPAGKVLFESDSLELVINDDMTGTIPSPCDFILPEARVISGTISIPESVTENRYIHVHAFTDKGTPDEADDIGTGSEVLIPAGETSVLYAINVPVGYSYRVQYFADPGYGYENGGFYSENGTVFDYYQATLLDLTTSGKSGIDLYVSKALAPSIVKAEAIEDGTAIKLYFSKPLDMMTLPSAPAGFTIKVSSDVYEISSVTANEKENELTLELDNYKIFKDYTNITLTYGKEAGVKSYDGMLLESITTDEPVSISNLSNRVLSIVTGFANGALLNKDARISVSTSEEAKIILKENESILVSGETSVTGTISSEGSHAITISVDGRKNDITITFTIDKTPPDIAILNCDNTVVINNHDGVTPTIEFSSDCVAASKVVTLNGQAYDGSTIKRAGEYILKASARDEAGNVRTVSKEFKIIWDTGAPVIVVSGVENGKIYQDTSIGISLARDAGIPQEYSNEANYYYKGSLKLPDGKVQTFDNNSIPSVTDKGAYRLEILAVNPSYTDITSKKIIEFTIDKDIPKTEIGNLIHNHIYNTEVTPLISFTDDVASQQTLIANATVTLTKGDLPVKNYHIGDTITADGVYTLTAETKDAFGHESEVKSVTFTIDRTKPVITTFGVLNGYTYKDQDVTVTIKTNEGTLTVICNGNTIMPDGNGQLPTFKGEEDKLTVYKLYAEAKDEAGNISGQELSFTIDRLAVNIKVNGISDGMLINYSPDITFTTFEGMNEKTGTAAEIDGIAFAGGSYTKEGSHTMVLSYTSGGNTYTKSINFIIDKTVPAISYNNILKNNDAATSVIYTKTGDSIKVRANISDTNGISEAYFSIGTAAAAIPMKYVEGSGYYEGEFFVGSGNYTEMDIIITAKDKAGNSASPKHSNVKVIIDNTKPVVSIKTDPAIADGRNGIFKSENMKITLTAGTTETIYYNFNNNPGSAAGTIQLSPAQGTNILVYKAQDPAENMSDEKIYIFEYDSIRPSDVILSDLTPETSLVNTETVGITGSVDNEGGKAGSKVLLKKANTGEVVASANIKADNTFVMDGIRLVEGLNSFTLTAMDLAGNESSTPTAISRTLDSTAPIIKVDKVDDIHYTISANEDVTLIVVKFNGIVIDKAKIIVDPANARKYTVETPDPVEGTNTLNASAADTAGNIGHGSYTSTYIPANTSQTDVQLNDNSTMDIPGTAFTTSVQMLVKTVDVDDNISYKPLGAAMNFEFVDEESRPVAPEAPLVIRNYIGAGLKGVALMHVNADGTVDRTITATVTTSNVFDMYDNDTIDSLGTFDDNDINKGTVIYIKDTGYVVFKTKTFSGYAVVQDVTAPEIVLSTSDFEINAADKSEGKMRIAGTLKKGGTGADSAEDDTTAYIMEVTIDSVVMDIGGLTEEQKGYNFNIPLDLADGTHEVEIRASDASGNASTLTRTYQVDVTPPVLTAEAATDKTNRDSVDIYISTDETSEICINGEYAGHFYGNNIIPFTLKDGSENEISVTAKDAFGNSSEAETIKVTRDSTAPSITISGVVNNAIYSTDREIVVSVTDTHDCEAVITMDGEAYIPGIYTVEGKHTLRVDAADSFGNTSSSVITFTIDKSVPFIKISGAENGGVYNSNKVIEISVENADEITVEISTDGQAAQSIPMELAGGSIPLGAYGEKHDYKITVTAKRTTAERTLISVDIITLTIDRKEPPAVTPDDDTGDTGDTGGGTIPVTPVTPVTPKPDIPENPETDTPETPEQVVPAVSEPVNGIITVEPVLTGNTANSAVTMEVIDTAFKQLKANAVGVKTIGIEVKELSDAKTYTQEIPASIMQAGSAKRNIAISMPYATVTIPGNMFTAADIGNKKTIEISVSTVDIDELAGETGKNIDKDIINAIGNKPVISLSASIDGKNVAWNNPDAPVEISIPYTPSSEELINNEHIVVWYIDGNGKVVAVPSGRYDVQTGRVTFTTTHFSKYAVSYVKKTFSDISDYSWAKKQIEVLASKGVINGKPGGVFDPGSNITRADFILLLVKALGFTAKADTNFADVKASDYYYEAVGIAKKLGITQGTGNNLFKPNEFITRQDMMVLVNRALLLQDKLSAPGNVSDLSKFGDVGKIAAYAKESIANLVNEGIILGSNSNINPLGNALRAEIAVVIYRIYYK
ncbi:MAG TPA: S-layer homology domain-containing protein [Clostridiales bacterium]|nr:S-layer homology domain-containing protein [Clostridiales bacterium]